MSGKSKAELNNEQKCEIHGISHHDCMSVQREEEEENEEEAKLARV